MKKNIFLVTLGVISIFYLQYTFSKISAKKALSRDEYSLYKAAYMGRDKKVRRLVEKGVNVNIQSPNSKRTPLHIAASKGKEQIVTLLITNGADLEIKNKHGQTPLFFAAKKGRFNVVEALVDKKAQITDDIIEISKNDKIKNYLETARKKNGQQQSGQKAPRPQQEKASEAEAIKKQETPKTPEIPSEYDKSLHAAKTAQEVTKAVDEYLKEALKQYDEQPSEKAEKEVTTPIVIQKTETSKETIVAP